MFFFGGGASQDLTNIYNCIPQGHIMTHPTIPPAELRQKNPFRAPSGFNLVEAVDLSAVPAGHRGVTRVVFWIFHESLRVISLGIQKNFHGTMEATEAMVVFLFLFVWELG